MRLIPAVGIALAAAAAPAAIVIDVTLDPSARTEPATGRLVVFLIGEDSTLFEVERIEPTHGPFFGDPQPMYGIDVERLAPGGTVAVGDTATAFPHPLSELPPGRYKAQALLDVGAYSSQPRAEPGNILSEVATLTIAPDAGEHRLALTLDRVVPPRSFPRTDAIRELSIRSDLLSAYHGRDVDLRAAVVLPMEHDRTRRYPAVYVIPGFGGDHRAALREQRSRHRPMSADARTLRESAFFVYLDPESANGHHLFADSACNGPVAEALLTELIPAVERRYRLIAEPEARLLAGHSSGGWSALWLALQHPETFAGCWSSAPDPIDFRAFQRTNIYADDSMYIIEDPASGRVVEQPAMMRGGEVTMTVRQENRMEEVLGPRNASAQQWDGWLAVFAPRSADGRPVDLFDPETGVIDPAVAAAWRAYDVGHLLRTDPGRYVPLLRERVRLVVGEADGFDLDDAVRLVAASLEELDPDPSPAAPGFIRIMPGHTHPSIAGLAWRELWPGDMVRHLRRHGMVPTAPHAMEEADP